MKPTVVIIVSLIIAGVITFTTSVWFGITIAAVSLLYQYYLNYGRTEAANRSDAPLSGSQLDIMRNAVFVIPLIVALVRGAWIVAGAIVIVFLVNLFTAYA